MAPVVQSGEFPLMRDVDVSSQPERSRVYSEWSKAFRESVPDAIEHLADVIEDVYTFELWRAWFLETPEQFFERMGLFDLDLDEPAKLIKELRKKRSSKKAQIIARAEDAKRLREQGKSTREIAAELGVTHTTVQRDMAVEQKQSPDTKNVPPRQRIRLEITHYTKPETAAGKLMDKFGDDWCRSLYHALGEVLCESEH